MPVIAGLVAFLISFVLLGLVTGEAGCRDGWGSPSIGVRGACSHHGGVDNSSGRIRWGLSIVAAIGAGALVNVRWPMDPQKMSGNRVGQPSPLVDSTVRCPKCQAAMRKRVSRRGQSQGASFWGCSRFPMCKGTRPI
jgi:hypothetical protein